jgi:hypothetical protein
MNDPQTFWLTVTNVALGAATLLLILALAAGALAECFSRIMKRRAARHELDAGLAHLFRHTAMSGRNVPTEFE